MKARKLLALRATKFSNFTVLLAIVSCIALSTYLRYTLALSRHNLAIPNDEGKQRKSFDSTSNKTGFIARNFSDQRPHAFMRQDLEVLPWTRPLGELSPAAIERLNYAREHASMIDIGGFQFYDPYVPDQIDAHMVHCVRGLNLRNFNLADLDSNRLVVVTTIDAKTIYHMPIYLSMLSERSEDVEILLMATGISLQEVERLCNFTTRYLTLPIHVLLLGNLDQFFKYDHKQRGILSHVSISTMARLLLPSLMGDIMGTVLYLDVDVVLTDLIRLNKDIISKMCPDYIRSQSDLCAKPSYRKSLFRWSNANIVTALDLRTAAGFNAGVMLLNLTNMKHFGFSRYATILSRTLCVNDQVILAAYSKNSFSRMNREFNVFASQETTDNASIIHFAGSNRKPWFILSNGHTIWQSYSYGRYLFVWPFFSIIPHEILASLGNHIPESPINVYCITVSCHRQVSRIGYPFAAKDLKTIKSMMRIDSPLDRFFSKLQLYKVLFEGSFLDIWGKALKLNILYHQGGILLPSRAKMKNSLPDNLKRDEFWFVELESPQNFLLSAQPKDQRIWKLMVTYMSQIEESWLKPIDDPRHTLSINLPFNNIFSRIDSRLGSKVHHCFEDWNDLSLKSNEHYSILWYDTRVKTYQPGGPNLVANLGDEIQSLASVSWLPFVDIRVERDSLSSPDLSIYPEKSITTFMNAWYGSKGMQWPPSNSINPILLAVHIEQSKFGLFSSNASNKYLKSIPSLMGARDTFTNAFLAREGIGTFFSGCMTLTTYPVPKTAETSECKYLMVDISEKAYQLLPMEVKKNSICRISQRLTSDANTVFNGKTRFIKAFLLLQRYSSAKVVITSRLHSALPASSIGATVILVRSKTLPGGGKGKGNKRFSGLDEIFLNVEERSLQTALKNFSWENPPPNPGAHLIHQFRCLIFKYLRRYHELLLDAVYVFDLYDIFKNCR